MEIRTSKEPAGVPGCYFHQEIFARNARYFTAYIDDKPVGQLALVKKGQFWWIDYLYVQKEFRSQGIVRALVKVVLPAAAQVTDYTWEQCEGVTPEDLARNSERYSLKMDVLRTYHMNNKPVTLIRRHLAPLRKAESVQKTA